MDGSSELSGEGGGGAGGYRFSLGTIWREQVDCEKEIQGIHSGGGRWVP